MAINPRPDPPVPADGTCAVCHHPKRPPKGDGRYAKRAAEEAAKDPFCSVDCCREYHNVPVSSYEDSPHSHKQPGRAPGSRPKRQPGKCSGCGGDLDAKTEGCVNCRSRHSARRKKSASSNP